MYVLNLHIYVWYTYIHISIYLYIYNRKVSYLNNKYVYKNLFIFTLVIYNLDTYKNYK